ncbi:MAG: response regulator [Thermodesulfobacteriota bacterium]
MKKKLLIIDDEPAIRQILEIHLASEGFDVVTSETVGEGLECIRGNNPDLVICDFRFPDMEGLEILRSIKSLSPAMPVIIISGFLDGVEAENIMTMGGVRFLKKPFTKEALLDAVNSLFLSSGVLPADV